jgi:tetratricopeptide (TPR) repeat protein
MHTLWAAICGSLMLAGSAYSQMPPISQAQMENGMDIRRSRALDSLSESSQPEKTHTSDASIPWRSLSSEAADDPTISGAATPHKALPAARKAARKADHLAKKGHHDEAIVAYRKALAIDPQYYEAANNLALELAAAGKTDEAEKTLRHLSQSAPAHVLAFTNLATLLLQQHRYVDAEAVARQALKLHQFSFKSNYLLGAALVDQGKWDQEARLKLEYAQVKYAEAKVLLDKWPAKAGN